MRWLYHVVRTHEAPRAGTDYAPASLGREGFIHASYASKVEETARLYFVGETDLVILMIDPRRVPHVVREERTPRGPMPHIFGEIPDAAIAERLTLAGAVASRAAGSANDDAALTKVLADKVQHTRIAFVAFEGMTLLDLVGVLDPVSRITSMGFDETLVCEVVSATTELSAYSGCKLHVTANAVRPSLSAYDLVVVAGGIPARALAKDPAVAAWLRAFGEVKTIASVCTGALMLGAAGFLRGKRATTHSSAKDSLAEYEATYVDERVVHDGTVVTAGGVTSGIDLGLYLVSLLESESVAEKIATQMQYKHASFRTVQRS